MDPGIISTLQYDTVLCLIELINTQRPCIYVSLLFYPISHKKCFITIKISAVNKILRHSTKADRNRNLAHIVHLKPKLPLQWVDRKGGLLRKI